MDTILQNISQTLFGWINSGFACLIEILLAANVSGSFTPSIDYWYGSETSAFNGKYEVLHDFCSYLGWFFLIALIGIFVLKMFVNGMGEELKDSIISIGYRLVLCIVMIWGISSLGDVVMSAGSALDTKAQEYFGDPGDVSGDDAYGELGESSDSDTSFLNSEVTTDSFDGDETAKKDAIGSLLGVTLTATGLVAIAAAPLFVLWLLVVIIRIVILFIAGYKLIKLVIELISKYVTMIIMYTALPTFVSFYLLIETHSIFFTYIKMFITSVMAVVFTRTWMSLSFFLYKGLQNSVVEVFVFIAFVEFGCRLEQWFKDIGFSTTSQGRALLDNTVMTAAGLGMALRVGKSATGKALVNAGAALGTQRALGTGLAMAGMGMQNKGMSEATALRGMAESAVGSGKALRAAKGASAIANNIRQGRHELAQGRLDNMKMPDRANALNAAIQGMYSNGTKDLASKGIDNISATGAFNKDGSIPVTAQMGGPEGTEIAGLISDRPAVGKDMHSIPFTDDMGNQKYFNYADPNSIEGNMSIDERAFGTPDGKAHYNHMCDNLRFMDDVDNAGQQYDNSQPAIGPDDSILYDMDDNGRATLRAEITDPATGNVSSRSVGAVLPNGKEIYAPQYDATSRTNSFMVKDGEEMRPLNSLALSSSQMQQVQLMSNLASEGQTFDAYGSTFVATQSGMWSNANVNVSDLTPTSINRVGNNTYEVKTNSETHTFTPAMDIINDLNGHEKILTAQGQERAGSFVHTVKRDKKSK